MSRQQLGALILLAGALALIGIWRLAPPLGLPLYDGLGLPPQSYRYLHPGSGTPQPDGPPTSAHQVLPVSGGKSTLTEVFTTERPPQAVLNLDDNSFILPRSVSSVIVTIKPVPPPAPLKAGVVDGNVYRVSAVTNTGVPAPIRRGKVSVVLRGTGALGQPVIEQYSGHRWVKLRTSQYLGVSMFSATITALGDFTLVLPSTGGTGTGLSSFLPFIVIAILIIVLTAVGLLLVRFGREREAEAQDA
jgi:hypothetical protein